MKMPDEKALVIESLKNLTPKSKKLFKNKITRNGYVKRREGVILEIVARCHITAVINC